MALLVESITDMCRYFLRLSGWLQPFSYWFFLSTLDRTTSSSTGKFWLSGFLVQGSSPPGKWLDTKVDEGNKGTTKMFFVLHRTTRSGSCSRLRAAALLVQFHLVLEAVVQFKVVVLQGCGGTWRQAAVGAGAVQEEAGAHRSEQDPQGAHHNDCDQDGVQGVQPGVVLLWDAGHRRFCWWECRVLLWDL